MEYAKSLNLLSAVLGCDARVVTRYNFAAKTEHEGPNNEGDKVTARRMKLVVASYDHPFDSKEDYEEVSFNLRATQVIYADGRKMPIEHAVGLMLEGEPTAIHGKPLEDTLRESGLGEKYLPALQAIVQTFKESTGNLPVIVGTTAEGQLGEPAIGMFLQDGDHCVVIQFKE